MNKNIKKIKQLKIKVPNNQKLAGWSSLKIKKMFSDKVSLCTYKGKPIPHALKLKRLIGKSVCTDWYLYVEQIKKLRNKGYKQKIIISHL